MKADEPRRPRHQELRHDDRPSVWASCRLGGLPAWYTRKADCARPESGMLDLRDASLGKLPLTPRCTAAGSLGTGPVRGNRLPTQAGDPALRPVVGRRSRCRPTRCGPAARFAGERR